MLCKKCGKNEIDPWTGYDSNLCLECLKFKHSQMFQQQPTKEINKSEFSHVKWLWIGLGIIFFIYFTKDGTPDTRAFSDEQICIATIAAIMGRNPSIIKLDSVQDDINFISYVRPNDGELWKYRCKLKGNRVIWASETGRWRSSEQDSKITFLINGSELVINEKFADNSAISKNFRIEQLKG